MGIDLDEVKDDLQLADRPDVITATQVSAWLRDNASTYRRYTRAFECAECGWDSDGAKVGADVVARDLAAVILTHEEGVKRKTPQWILADAKTIAPDHFEWRLAGSHDDQARGEAELEPFVSLVVLLKAEGHDVVGSISVGRQLGGDVVWTRLVAIQESRVDVVWRALAGRIKMKITTLVRARSIEDETFGEVMYRSGAEDLLRRVLEKMTEGEG